MFRLLLDAGLRQRTLVLAASLVLLLLGLREARRLPVDVLPDLTRPTVAVQVEAAGYAVEDVEAQVTFPVESALAGLPGLARLRSLSTAGLATVTAEFDWDSDVHRNRQWVAERLEAARGQWPEGLRPRIGPPTSLMGEILLVALQPGAATDAEADAAALDALRSHAEWTLRPALLAVPGVAQVLAIGGGLRQFEVQPDPGRMRLHGVTLDALAGALRDHGRSRGGGLIESQGQEVALRMPVPAFGFDELAEVAVPTRGDGVVRVGQVADLVVGHRFPRGAAGANGRPAVILAIQKAPGVDTLALTTALEARLLALDGSLPPGSSRLTVFRQADFIRHSIDNLGMALRDGALIVAGILLLFLASGRATVVALAAIPLSMLAAILSLRAFGFGIDTMTLGGLAIAIGELVDDAVVGVENVIRRLRETPARGAALIATVARATLEVRSGIVHATLVIVLVFVPLFALDGIEGRLFAPLGIAYIAAILASLVVAITVTPVLCVSLLGSAARLPLEPRWLARFTAGYRRGLAAVLTRPAPLLIVVAALFATAAVLGARLPRHFLPPFNEGTLTINLVAEPGIALGESDRLGRVAEQLLIEVPEVASVARRTGRAEADEHAEGVHYSEIDVALHESGTGGRPRAEVIGAIRARLALLPAQVSISQPITHRLDHLLSGVRAPLVVKLHGPDLAELRRLAEGVKSRLAGIPGLADVALEAQRDVPQIDIAIDSRAAADAGIAPARARDAVAALGAGLPLAELIDGDSRTLLLLRLPPPLRGEDALAQLLVDGRSGPVPLGWIAELTRSEAPNQILREQLGRRIAISAYPDAGAGPDLERVGRDLASLALPPGYRLTIEGQAAAQAAAMRRIGGLAVLSLLLMAAVLHGRYRSWRLVAIILGNVPLALIGGVLALSLSGTPLSLASLVGFVTLCGIAARNGILKISRYLQLAREQPVTDDLERVLQGSAERLTPVLMTALIAALSLSPLLFGGDAPGKEILHPVALVIFGGLLSSTLLDSFLTPLMYLRFAGRDASGDPARFPE